MIINNKNIQKVIKDNSKTKNRFKRLLISFVCGGIIGILGELLYVLYKSMNVIDKTSSLLSSATIMFIAFILTCIGVFDKIANIAMLGILIPISGFSNSITSCALEGKSEGVIIGIGSKLFSLIGSVLVSGIVSSIILGFIYYFYRVMINA